MYRIEPIFVIFPLLCLLFALLGKRYNKLLFPLLSVAFLCVYTLSLNGSDIIGYRDIYTLISSPETFDSAHSEIGFKYIMLLCSKLNVSYLAFRIGFLAVNTLVLFYTVFRLSPNFSLSLFFLTTMFVIYTISTYRQYSVMCFSLYWFYYYSKRKNPMPFIGIALLMLIHISAAVPLIFLIVYALCNKRKMEHNSIKLSRRVIVWIIFAFILRFLFILLMQIEIVRDIMRMLTRGYSDYDMSLVSFGLISRVAFMMGISIMFRIRKPHDNITVMLFLFYFVGIFLYIAVPFTDFMGRLMNNMHIISVILVPLLFIKREKTDLEVQSNLMAADRINVIQCVMILLVLTAVVILINQLLNQNGYTPYLNILLGDRLV